MSKTFHEVGGYNQIIEWNEKKIIDITCTCKWTTFEIGRHPNYEDRNPCKHIKKLLEDEKKRIN
ncbi:MAG: SWIM zinc finger family protein [Promethearchaeota archaeon]